MKVIGLILLLIPVFGIGWEALRLRVRRKRALAGAEELIRHLTVSVSEHAETVGETEARFPGGVGEEFDRVLREKGLREALASDPTLFSPAAGGALNELAEGLGQSGREAQLALLSAAAQRIRGERERSDAGFRGDLLVTATLTLAAAGALLLFLA